MGATAEQPEQAGTGVDDRDDLIERGLLVTPFPIGGPASASWREQALGRAAEYRFLARLLLSQATERERQALLAIERHLDAAERAAEGHVNKQGKEKRGSEDGAAAMGRGDEPGQQQRHESEAGRRPLGLWARFAAFLGGASVERVTSQLDAVETDLLRLAPDPYLRGALPNLVAHVRDHLPKGDPRREQVETIAQAVAARPAKTPLSALERDQTLGAVRAASLEGRREIRRVRSFRNVLLVSALILTLGVAGITAVGVSSPGLVPLCFAPDNTMVVCPTGATPVPEAPARQDNGTAGSANASAAQQARVDEQIRDTASAWDIPVVEIAGLLAAALAGAFTLRSIQGTSTPYSLPVALAALKLPSGALTAVLGLLLMRGGFIPGLSALDSSAQIIAWAIVFGYAQQLLTRLIDQQANTVLENVGQPLDPPLEAASAPQAMTQPTQPVAGGV
jgi:hypothetical protein